MSIKHFEIYTLDKKEEINEFSESGYGHAHWKFTQEHINALLEGKILAFNDGEYTHSIEFSKEGD